MYAIKCNENEVVKMVKKEEDMHRTLTKSVLRQIECLTFTSIAINICARMNNYVGVDKLSRTSF